MSCPGTGASTRRGTIRQRSPLVAAALSVLLISAACGRNTPLPREVANALTGNKHHFDHFLIVVLENEDAKSVNSIPYMDSLARRGVAMRKYYAVAHPSYPNYLALIAGNTFIGSRSRVRPDPKAYNRRDFGDAQLLIDAPTIVDRLEAAGKTWDAFAEDYPIVAQTPKECDWRRSAGLYTRKHFPFLSFVGFHQHPEWCSHVRNLKWLRPDSLAEYTFVAPNLVHDGHDAPLSTAAHWLRGFLEPILADSAVMSNTLVVVTFDESSTSLRQAVLGTDRPNIVYTVLLGGMVKAGTTSDDVYDHFNLLRTVEANFGLSPSLLPDGVGPIEGVWR